MTDKTVLNFPEKDQKTFVAECAGCLEQEFMVHLDPKSEWHIIGIECIHCGFMVSVTEE
jgi:hypothetical protein